MLSKGAAVTAEWLTERLRAYGGLQSGHIVSVRETANDAFTSLVVHLDVEYSKDAEPGLPRRLLLKRMDSAWGEREVGFYRSAMADSGGSVRWPLVQCLEATYDDSTGRSQVLLVDLTASHASPISRERLIAREMPSLVDLASVMRALGGFHAKWWEDPRIAVEEPFLVRSWYSDPAAFGEHLARREREVEDLKVPTVDEEIIEFYEQALRRLPVLWDRFLADRMRDRRALTMSHGDCYLTQWLCPRSGDGSTYVVDFDSVSGNVPAFDLVYLLAAFSMAESRRGYELEMLREYHRSLRSEGVSAYDWESLVLDYRLMLSFIVFDPVFDHSNGSRREYWWPKMSSLIDAYRDWGSPVA